VRRELHSADKRRQEVFLTDEGRALQSRLVPIVSEFLSEALEGLSKEDVDEMIRILGRITQNLERSGDARRSVLPLCSK
jgi:MarR family transcriptional regulator, organic hydroperoxide resistance regulator